MIRQLNIYILIGTLLFSFSCKEKISSTTEDAEKQNTTTIEKKTDSDPLTIQVYERYLDYHAINPYYTINNVDMVSYPFEDDNKIMKSEIILPKHRITWTRKGIEANFTVDNRMIALKNNFTINYLWGNDKPDEVNFANDWDQIKYYKIAGREIICIRMVPNPCNGIGCGVAYYAINDLQSKKTHFFGTFRASNEMDLYDFGKNKSICFISKNYDTTPEDQIITHKFYRLDNKGDFVELQNDINNAYSIELRNDSIAKVNWFEEIKTIN